MTEKERYTYKKWYGEFQILDYNKGFAVIDTYTQAKIICKELNELHEENEQLKQEMQRLYNYFADWFEEIVPQSDFSEIWDGVKEDEEWD